MSVLVHRGGQYTSLWERIVLTLRYFSSEKLGAKSASRRMKIRDRGAVTPGGGAVYPHGKINISSDKWYFCPALLRIGKKDDQTVVWCWRCEMIVAELQGYSLDNFLQSLNISPHPR